MPLPNRVDPFGTIFATEERGGFMGNRGGRLHDARKTIVRRWTSKAWITCLLAFKNYRRKEVMGPDSYTELFFLDEATALAAGHRPCAECRRADYNRFKALFVEAQAALGVNVRLAADLDAVLHAERLVRPRAGARAGDLPDAAMVAIDGQAWLKLGDRLLAWTPGGYGPSRALPEGEVEVLTPAAILAVLHAGYVAQVDASAGASTRLGT